ncbi:MAG: GH3 auxin-responsive promoter family protein [Bacteroidales bacterium]|jgi:hypothetical protein
MPVINSIISWFVTKRKYEIDFFKKYPVEVQNDTFKQLIKQGRNTVFGKDHNFQNIETYSDFTAQVPVRDYPAIKPYIDRAMLCEPDVLWPGETKWFAKSSGTTGDKSKFIPVTRDNIEECHFQGGKDTLIFYFANYPDNELLSGKSLAIGGSHQVSDLNSEVYFGDVSAVLLQNLPIYAHWIRTPELSVALMNEWEEKLQKMADITCRENVTSLAGVPSWTLVLLKKILEKTGKTKIIDVWPNLEVFMHGGVSFTPYRNQFQTIIGSDKVKYMETYNASEGFFGIQDDPDDSNMLLMLDYGVFYEFIAVEDLESENPKALTLADVETGRNYAMVISTSGGLWRYLIGDTIRFSSLIPVKFKITGRTRHFINAFGEELIIDNAEFALRKACLGTNAEITEYTAAPVFMAEGEKARHQWLIEFSRPPENPGFFVELLDNALKSVNSDYEAKRYKNLALHPPELLMMKTGTFYEWLKMKGHLGGQHKIPRLSNDRAIVDEILKIDPK